MANEQNLIPFTAMTESQQRAIASKGGKASAKARQERKTVQNMLTKYFDSKISDDKQLKKLADKIGIEGDESVKYLYTVVCAMNTLKKGELKDLRLIMELLGETPQSESSEAVQQAEFLDAVKKAVSNENQ
nr:MAG TPA: hypothetical protein [Caudoviricetes sp.]